MGFFRNGGLIGLAEGYRAEEHGGKPFDFDDLGRSVQKISGITADLGNMAIKGIEDERRIRSGLGSGEYGRQLNHWN